MVYQISYVIRGQPTQGEITEIDHQPRLGEVVTIKGKHYRIIELKELIKPLSQFTYFHALCEQI